MQGECGPGHYDHPGLYWGKYLGINWVSPSPEIEGEGLFCCVWNKINIT